MLRTASVLALIITLSSSVAGTEAYSGELSKVDKLINEGRRMLKAGAVSKAEELFRQAVEAAPGSAVAHNELGVALFQRGAIKAAIKPLRRAVKIDRQLAHAWANLAEAERLSGKYKRAALSYHRFLTLRKGDRYGIYGLALCFEGYEKLDKALKTLAVAKKRSEADPRLLARVNTAVKRVREKIAEARLSLLQRGDARLMAGRWDAALKLYEKGLVKTPKDPTLTGRRGLVKAIQGDIAAAKTDLRTAILADPAEATARNAYALILDAEDAAGANPDAGTNDANKRLAADRAALALRAFTAALAVAEGDPTPLYLGRAEAQLRLGGLDPATEDLAAAGDSPDVTLGLAEIHLLRGQNDDAAALAAEAPVVPADIPVWRRSLLQSK